MKEYIEFVCECGKLLKVPKERAGQTGKCSKCSKSVTIPFSSNTGKEAKAKNNVPAPAKEEPRSVTVARQSTPAKKEVKKNSYPPSQGWKIAFLILLFFLLGIFVGVAIGPEYWNVLPPKEKILWWKERIPEPIKTLPQEEKRNAQNTDSEKKSSNIQEIYNREKPRVEVAARNIETYLVSLNKEITELKEKKNLLETQYSISVPEQVDLLLKESQQMKTGLEERLSYAKDALQESGWRNLPQAYNYLQDYESLQAENSPLIKNLQKTSQKIESDISQYQKHLAKKPIKQNSQYLGSWYDSLKRNMDQWKNIGQTGQSTSGKSGILVQHIHQIIKKIESYPNEIEETSDTLFQSMSKKDVQTWIQFRKEQSSSSSQRRQGTSIEQFLQKGKKFELEIAGELDTLQNHILSFQSKIQRQESTEEVAGKILAVLRTIERKYSESYKDFNAGVIHFENYN
ncbi:MAG: hypothetical protein HUU50_13820 [Candidatus Brocadiae bacterium]|nr:hypothetical protein [Candidatus Brocadiia bacterium]